MSTQTYSSSGSASRDRRRTGAVSALVVSAQDGDTPASPAQGPAEPIQAAPSQADSLGLVPLAASIVADRMRAPRAGGAVLAGAVLFGHFLGAHSRR